MGQDKLTGLNAAATWQVGLTDQYTSGNSLSFSRFENLIGGSGSDRFVVSAPSSVTVAGQGGNDILDFGTLSGPASAVLKSANATGFGGTGTLTFAGIDTIVGSSSTGDSLVNAIPSPTSHWNLQAQPTFSDGTHTLSFSRIDDVTGSQGVTLAFGAASGQDLTLRYSAATRTAQLVNTVTSVVIASSKINATADNLVRVVGTAGADVLRIDPSVPGATGRGL